jgi:DNA-binding FadR family transcriptional regulator
MTVAQAPGFARRGLGPAVVDALGRQIVAGEIAPGGSLPIEAELAGSFGVSRTVVREAVRVLVAKGLVDSSPMRGTRVRPRSSWHLLDPDVLGWWAGVGGAAEILADLAEIRRIVEPPAARLAAERIGRGPGGGLDELEDAWKAMQASVDDLDGFIEADLRFHGAILRATRNVLLDQLLAAVGAGLRLAREVQASADGGGTLPGDPLPLHAAVVEAIRAGDGRAAKAAMRAVVKAAARDAERALARAAGAS